ncbi:hypothetical protein BDR26DRAFT_865902 [Obelidium mucronatum]|nr:hypothetical protein BDR26DRAFT_865902 [Obelidium mucronatum]
MPNQQQPPVPQKDGANRLKYITRSPLIIAVFLALTSVAMAIAATILPDFYQFNYSVKPFGVVTEETGVFKTQVCQNQKCVIYASDLCTTLFNEGGIGNQGVYPASECNELTAIRVLLVIADVIGFLAAASLIQQYRIGTAWVKNLASALVLFSTLLLATLVSLTVHLKSRPLFTASADTNSVVYGRSFYLICGGLFLEFCCAVFVVWARKRE